MARCMLLCTYNVPGKIIDELLEISAKPDTATEEFRWSLMRTAEQPLEDPTEPPVANFKTSFEGSTIEELGSYFRARYVVEFPKAPATWNAYSFGVLDERSVRDKTLLMVAWWEAEPIDESPDDEDVQEAWMPTGWKTLRVRFEDAAWLAMCIDINDSLYLEECAGPENFREDETFILPK